MSLTADRLREIQKHLKCDKSQTNTFGGYKFRSFEDILEAVKPLLEDALLTITDEMVNIGNRYYVKATITIQVDDPISVTAYAREEESKKGFDASQITGAASSYSRKYAANGLFLIDDTKDADTQDNTKQEKKKPQEDVPDKIMKATPQQKIDIRSKMVAAEIEEHGEQKAFYTFVMTEDTHEKAQRFIDDFDAALEIWRNSKNG